MKSCLITVRMISLKLLSEAKELAKRLVILNNLCDHIFPNWSFVILSFKCDPISIHLTSLAVLQVLAEH